MDRLEPNSDCLRSMCKASWHPTSPKLSSTRVSSHIMEDSLHSRVAIRIQDDFTFHSLMKLVDLKKKNLASAVRKYIEIIDNMVNTETIASTEQTRATLIGGPNANGSLANYNFVKNLKASLILTDGQIECVNPLVKSSFFNLDSFKTTISLYLTNIVNPNIDNVGDATIQAPAGAGMFIELKGNAQQKAIGLYTSFDNEKLVFLSGSNDNLEGEMVLILSNKK